MPPMDAELLRQYLEFYRDLGIKTLYKQSAPAHQSGTDAFVRQPAPDATRDSGASHEGERVVAGKIVTPEVREVLPDMAPAGDTLTVIQNDIGDCQRCRLHEGRNKIVFGVGSERAPLVLVGEVPGADEDQQGIPFVGRAGQLLTQMIEGTAKKEGIALTREDVYICNVVKCRPPGNRTPEPDEMEICGQFLSRQ